MASYYDDIPSSPEEDSTNPDDAIAAAILFSRVMNEAEIKHGYMGGFACRTLGSTRHTEDVDCCVEAKWLTIRSVLQDKKEYVVQMIARIIMRNNCSFYQVYDPKDQTHQRCNANLC
jgi:hypothetical protein